MHYTHTQLSNWEGISFPVMSCSSARTHHHEVVMCTRVAVRACFLLVSGSVITLFGEWKQGVYGSLSSRLRSHKYINTKIERSNFLLGICVFSFPDFAPLSLVRVYTAGISFYRYRLAMAVLPWSCDLYFFLQCRIGGVVSAECSPWERLLTLDLKHCLMFRNKNPCAEPLVLKCW